MTVIKRCQRGQYTVIKDELTPGWYAEREVDSVVLRSRVYPHQQAIDAAIRRRSIRLTDTPVEQLDRSLYDKNMTSWLEHVVPADTLGRYDLLPAFQDADLLQSMVYQLSHAYEGKIDFVAAPESLGWILGGAIAQRLEVGFVGIRKRGKLPYPEDCIQKRAYFGYNGKNALELVKGVIPAGSRVLIADEWIETGGTAQACIDLVQAQGGVIAGICAIGIDHNERTDRWISSRLLTFISDAVDV